jgi:lysozyme
MYPRVAIAALGLSATALVGLFVSEGYTDRAVIPVPGDRPTYGFGMTHRPDGTPVQLGDKTTPVQAAKDTLREARKYEGALKQCVHVPLSQVEFDVYVDLAYNIGPTAFCGSTIVKRLNKQDYRGACDAILLWKMFQGFDCSTPGNKVCSGLWQRRLEAHQKCMEAQ